MRRSFSPSSRSAGALVLVAVAFAGLQQGAFYRGPFWAAIGLVALVIPWAARAGAAGRVLLASVLPPAGVVVASGFLHHHLSGTVTTLVLIGAATVTAAAVSAGDRGSRAQLRSGLLWIGLMVATTGWWGVAAHRAPWALVSGGLWRAASTITYANATGAVLAAAALMGLGMAIDSPRRGLNLVLTIMLGGLGATLARGALMGLVAGLVLLALTCGWRRLAPALVPPAIGGGVILAGLGPSLASDRSAHPAAAVVGLAVGLVVAEVIRCRPGLVRRTPLTLATAAVAAAGLVAVAASGLAGAGRLSLSSPSRQLEWSSAWAMLVHHPWLGVGPGPTVYSWVAGAERFRVGYAHNEYLQFGAQEGVVGLVALVLAAGWLLRRVMTDRPGRLERGPWAGALAGLASMAVGSLFDFLWHIPVLPLTGAVLAGLCLVPVGRQTAEEHPTPTLPAPAMEVVPA